MGARGGARKKGTAPPPEVPLPLEMLKSVFFAANVV